MHSTSQLKAVLVSAFVATFALADDRKDQAKLDDQEFSEEAARAGLTEVKLSELAVSQAADEGVRDFARTMVSEHGRANEELRALIGKTSTPLPTSVLSVKSSKKYDDLAMLSGDKFDKAYMATMVSEHEKAVKLFENEAMKGKQPQLKEWAAGVLPTLKHHYVMAQALETTVKNRMANAKSAR